uniref:Uncharacterized protein n=1 Tax=Arundo donax TaxID=35708 RepID=A0A0A9HP43_ARUDO
MSCFGFTPPKSDPTTDFPWRISREDMESGAPCISTPRMIVLPHPCTSNGITWQELAFRTHV